MTPIAWRWLLAAVALKLGAHVATDWQYGFQRDELYYLDCARRLAWGFVDFPPVTPAIAFVDQRLFPGSLEGLRLAPAVAGAVIVLLAGLIARELGGGARTQGLAALAALLSPMFLGANLLFQTVTFDELSWAAVLFLLARLLRTGDHRIWPVLGVAFGLGLETKYQISMLGAGVAVGLLLTRERRQLLTPWPWLGLGIAVALFAPNLIWQGQHCWPSLVYTRNHQADIAQDPRSAYGLEQLLLFGPLLLPLAVLGVWRLWRDDRFRVLFWAVVVVEIGFLVVGGKSYYAGPIYTLLYAAGAVAAADLLDRAWARRLAVAAAVAGTLVLLPLGLPVLPPQAMASAGLWKARKDYADMFGWQALAAQVSAVYSALPADQRAGAVILADNFGESGAIDEYGPRLGLPAAYSGHLSYWLWGPPPGDAQIVITIGVPRAELESEFESVEQAGTIDMPYGIHNEEYGRPIFICSRPRLSLAEWWPSQQHYS
ncbi:MAG TPA: glycosyltransferase family 39 protein [Candidatus Dormibacteraeota bacterium]